MGKLIGSLPVGVEDVRRGLHQTLRGVVADQTAAELAADIAGRARVVGEQVQDDIAVLLSLKILDNLAHHHFCVREMAGRVEFEETRIAVDAPAGETGGRAVDIAVDIALAVAVFIDNLRVAGLAHAEIVLRAQAVKLEQLPRVVLVGVAAGVGLVVQIVEHCGAAGHIPQHLAEVAQHIAPDHIPVVVDKSGLNPRIPAVDIEVVVPEIGQHFGQLPFAVEQAHKGHPFGLPHGQAAIAPIFGRVAFDVVCPQLGLGFAQGLEVVSGDNCVAGAVVDAGRVELLVHIGGQPLAVRAAQGVEGGDVAGPGAKAHPVERDDRQTGQSGFARGHTRPGLGPEADGTHGGDGIPFLWHGRCPRPTGREGNGGRG